MNILKNARLFMYPLVSIMSAQGYQSDTDAGQYAYQELDAITKACTNHDDCIRSRRELLHFADRLQLEKQELRAYRLSLIQQHETQCNEFKYTHKKRYKKFCCTRKKEYKRFEKQLAALKYQQKEIADAEQEARARAAELDQEIKLYRDNQSAAKDEASTQNGNGDTGTHEASSATGNVSEEIAS